MTNSRKLPVVIACCLLGIGPASAQVSKETLESITTPDKVETSIGTPNFIDGSGKSFNTIHANTFKFYEELNAVIQKEPLDLLDPETRGLLASIGIVKGKPFVPDARMKKILTDAVAIGNATTRSIV